ncbi:MAG: hypothetical protein A2Z20_05865 [Bdellovibrionales bacterium RBG_16_40_8]|nr:MAG: hypothetical protein A2Z20_05865 [Bdellovibrionales bacterium RBG_16_40_8]
MYKRIILLLIILIVSATQVRCSNDVSFATSDLNSQAASSGLSKSELFTQGTVSKKLDVLFVVDNSVSMAEEQQKMGQKIDSFLSTLYDIDWQLGVTTTDVSNGKYGIKGDLITFSGTNSYILTKKTPNFSQAFLNTVVRAESYNCGSDCASGDEQPLRAAIEAINKRNTNNHGFFRNDADFGLLILSDENEMSTGPANATPPSEVINTVKSIWGDSKKLLSYGMIIIPGDIACLNQQSGGGYYGTFVAELALLTGGLVGSICAENYAPTLGLLADHARKLLEYVQLKYYPAPESIVIKFTPYHISSWHVDGRRIYFDNPPPKDTVINVDYVVK